MLKPVSQRRLEHIVNIDVNFGFGQGHLFKRITIFSGHEKLSNGHRCGVDDLVEGDEVHHRKDS